MEKVNLWGKWVDKLTDLGLLKRGYKKWGQRLTEKEEQKLIKYIEDKQPPQQYSKIVLPMEFDHFGYEFGEKAKYGVRTVYHPGVDLNLGATGNADLGKPIVALATGTVTYRANTSGWGWHTYILHDILHKKYGRVKCWSHYAHLKEMPIFKPGALVKAGEQIGKCGGTGGWSPHLHLEIRKNALGTTYFPYGKSLQFVKDNYFDPLDFIVTNK